MSIRLSGPPGVRRRGLSGHLPTLTVSLAFLAAAASPVGATPTLYGVTSTQLVTLDAATGAATVVGSLGLAGNQSPGPLAWNPQDNRLYGFVYDFAIVGLEAVFTEQRFVSINPATAAVTSIATFGSQQTGIVYDSIEYIGGSVGSLVVGRGTSGGNSGTTELATISTLGVPSAFRSTTLDNDLLAWAGDSRLISIDPNHVTPASRARELDIQNAPPTQTFLTGSLPSSTTGELAWDLAGGRLYALDYTLGNRSLYRMSVSGSTLSLDSTVTVSGSQVRGIAFAQVPEPATLTTAGGFALLAWGIRRRLKTR